MPFCRKCGFEVDAGMSFCPKCGAAQAPSTVQSRGYGYRVAAFLVPQALLWVLLVVLWMLRFSFYGDVSWYSQLILLAFGLAAGVAIAGWVTRRQLSTLNEKGEMRILGLHSVAHGGRCSRFWSVASGCYVCFSKFFTGNLCSSYGLYLGAGISLVVGRAFFLVRWARVHKMDLYQKWWSNKIYAIPKPDSPCRQYFNR
jgi:hypothetical protein